MSTLPKNLFPIILFTAAYLLVATVFACIHQNWEFIFYIAVVIVLIGLTLVVYKRVQLSAGLLWLLTIWGLAHMVGGLVPTPESFPIDGDKAVFYSWWIVPGFLKYDNVIHAYGFGTCTWLCWQALKPSLKSKVPTFGMITLCALAASGLGAMNEIVEFIAVLTIPDTNVGGYINTGWDTVANAIGAAIAGFCIWKWERR